MKRWHLILISVLLIGAIIYLVNRLEDVKRESYSRFQIIQEKNSKIKTWKDNAGKWRAEKTAAVLDKRHLRQQLDSVKSLPPEVETYTRIITETKDSLVTQPPDTIMRGGKPYFGSFDFKTRWIDLRGYPYNGGLGINYTVYDSLEIFTSWRSRGWFKKDQLYIEAVSHNPNTKFTGIKNLTLMEPQNDKFVLSVGTGLGINNNLNTSWNIIELHLGYKLLSF